MTIANASIDRPELTENADLEHLKKSARRLRKFLANRGVQLSHTLSLEAVSHSVGAMNWKTLRAKLGMSDKTPAFEGPRYLVNAIYRDNQQLYSDSVDADTPLQAALWVQLERLTDGGSITSVDITEVIDRANHANIVLAPSYLEDLQLESFVGAVDKLLPLARMALGPAPQRGVLEAEAWDQKNQALELWGHLCKRSAKGLFDHELASVLEDLYEDPDFDKDEFGKEPPVMADLSGEWQEVDPLQMLKDILELAAQAIEGLGEDSDPKTTGRFQLEQLRLTVAMHEDRLAVVFNGLEIA